MANLEDINSAIAEIAVKRNELSKLDYSDERYDEIEDALHDLEDDLIDEHGDYLEDVIMDVHDSLCPDIDVLLPTAYLAKTYVESGKMETGETIYELGKEDGVYVEMDDYLNADTRLVIIPNPVRIWLIVNGEPKEEVWNGK